MKGRAKPPKTPPKSDKWHPTKNRMGCSCVPLNPPRPAEPKSPNRLIAIIRNMDTQDTR